MRWLLLEEVLTIEKGREAKAKGRYPGPGVTPEILLVEMMAQTAGILVGAESDFQHDVIFAKIEDVRFEFPLKGGEEILIEASSDEIRLEGGWMNARVLYQNKNLAKARFLLMNVGRIVPGQTKSTTFHDAFMNHFSIRQKVKSPQTASASHSRIS